MGACNDPAWWPTSPSAAHPAHFVVQSFGGLFVTHLQAGCKDWGTAVTSPQSSQLPLILLPGSAPCCRAGKAKPACVEPEDSQHGSGAPKCLASRETDGVPPPLAPFPATSPWVPAMSPLHRAALSPLSPPVPPLHVDVTVPPHSHAPPSLLSLKVIRPSEVFSHLCGS